MSKQTSKYLRKRSNYIKLILPILLIVGAIGYFVISSGKKLNSEESRQVIKNVSALAILPEETPDIAIVDSAKGELKNNYLKTVAKDGDRVLLFYKSRKIYVYRPSINKIVDVSVMVIDPSAAQVDGTKIMVLNGTADPNSAAAYAAKAKEAYPKAVVSEGANPQRQDYPKTIIIDLTSNEKYDLVTNMISAIGGVRGVLPNGETAPEGIDVLVITGLSAN